MTPRKDVDFTNQPGETKLITEAAFHTTQQEIRFITGLGSYGSLDKKGENNKTRKQLLRNYLIAAESRVEWDGMDKEHIIEHALNKLIYLKAEL